MTKVDENGLAQKKIAIVTGAGNGIGRQIAMTLLEAGWDLAITDIDTSALSQFADKRLAEKHVLPFTQDVADVSAAKALHYAILERFETPATLLVNNAGVQTWSRLLDLDIEEWERTIRTNLTGCFVQTQAFARALVGSDLDASIINIGSGCNRLAFPQLVDYTASKGGIEMFTKSAALELGEMGIRVNCIAPGAILNERTLAETEDYSSKWSALTPLGRVGNEADIANAILLLADSRAQFISGQTIAVDGGLFSRAVWPEQY